MIENMNYYNFRNYIQRLSCMLGLVLLFSCETTELELLDDPNAVAPAQSDIDYFLNNIQNAFKVQLEGTPLNTLGLNEFGMEVTRITHMFGPTYQNAYATSDLNQVWRSVYSNALPDIRTMTPLAEEQGLYTHVAIAKVLEAYMMTNMVDFFGDVPYSEAAKGTEFPNPNVDSGADVYNAVLNLLDEAIADFNKDEVSKPASDLFYDADEGKWIKLANTLKLKIYVQTRLVDGEAASKINAIVNGGNYITSSSDDFVAQYSSVDNNPDSRHPEFGPNFDNGTAEYMNTNFMYWLVEEKGIEDPRWRYYFYRQTLQNTTDVNEQSCITKFKPEHYGPNDVFCNFSDAGFWGRDHGNADGIPPDRGVRTAFGQYPVGGRFDDNSGQTIIDRNIGLQGAGISPIMLASFVDFMLAESALTIGVSGNPRNYLENGVRKSISKVMNFSPDNTDPDFVPSEQDVEDYVATVLNAYDNAGNQEEQLEIIIKEYFIALWGNGIEAYNTYRRTGMPRLQPTILADPGPFIRTFFYPAVFADQNSNVDQKTDVTQQVFWDNNPANFIN